MANEKLTSKHADLLNALDEMQQSMAYACRRDVLVQAERLIAEQEREIIELRYRLGRCLADEIAKLI